MALGKSVQRDGKLVHEFNLDDIGNSDGMWRGFVRKVFFGFLPSECTRAVDNREPIEVPFKLIGDQ